MLTNPTPRTYNSLEGAYSYFNLKLFDGKLPPCLITMQRHKGAYGYFSGNRFASVGNPDEMTDEIALNPAAFADRETIEILSTLAHEMAHLWQHHFGKPSRNGYHNQQWAAKMREIGLIPTDTGQPDGKETGQKMTHTIQRGGLFEEACTDWIIAQGEFLYYDRAVDQEKAKKKRASKTKYVCPSCELNAWAKPDAFLVCGDCGEPMDAEPADHDEE
jgi:predicted SprT family Zn-dependent metalloprotease